VGVFIRVEHRGVGLIERLLDETVAWLQLARVAQVFLHVNEHNTRAQGAYLKCGFVDSGVRVDMIDGINHEMVRSL
jgi:ribosomal protein S18 acetylase RimI-like enzyme